MSAHPEEQIKRLIADRDYTEAVRHARRALLVDADDIEVRLLLGEALLALERYEETRVEMATLVKYRPRWAAAHRLLGEALLRSERAEQAVHSLSEALALDAEDDVARALLREAVEDPGPRSQTIERWFADVPSRTVETETPESRTPMEMSESGARNLSRTRSDSQPLVVDERFLSDASLVSSESFDDVTAPQSEKDEAFDGMTEKPSAAPLAPVMTKVQTPKAMSEQAPVPRTQELDLSALIPISQEPRVPPELEIDDDPTTAFLSDEITLQSQGRNASSGNPSVPVPDVRHRPMVVPEVQASQLHFDGTTGAGRLDARPMGRTPSPPTSSPVHEKAFHRPEPLPAVRSGPPAGAVPKGQAREQVRRGRKALMYFAGGLAIVTLFLLMLSVFWSSDSAEAIQTASLRASDSGRASDFSAAVRLIEQEDELGPIWLALKARLLATMVFECSEDRADEVRALLTLDTRNLSDGRIASAYLALAENRPRDALRHLDGLTASGDQIQEALRARAFATWAVGRMSDAAREAAQASRSRPSAVRHRALALILEAYEQQARGLPLSPLEPVTENSDIVLHLARARVALLRRQPEASTAAEVVLSSAEASPRQQAWAHLVLAAMHTSQGEVVSAREHALQATEQTLASDAAFLFLGVDTLLSLGEGRRAQSFLAQSTRDLGAPTARALWEARTALAVGDSPGLQRAINNMARGTAATYLRGRSLELQRNWRGAHEAYDAVRMTTGEWAVQAQIRAMLRAIHEGDRRGIERSYDDLRVRAASDPRVAAVVARGLMKLGRSNDAAEVLRQFQTQGITNAYVKLASARLAHRRGQSDIAVGLLREACALRPHDPALLTQAGDLAVGMSELRFAEEVFQAAVAQTDHHPSALLGLGWLAYQQGNYADGEAHLRVASLQASDESAALRAAFLAARGEGALGIPAVSPFAEGNRDPRYWLHLGQLRLQAERLSAADQAFAQTLVLEPNNIAAILGRVETALHRGDLNRARAYVERAEEIVRTNNVSERWSARLNVANARLVFEDGALERVSRLCEDAVAASPNVAGAHILLAAVAKEDGRDPIPELRLAMQGQPPTSEALSQLALELGPTDEGCDVAQRYLAVAPGGFDARDVRRLRRRCR